MSPLHLLSKLCAGGGFGEKSAVWLGHHFPNSRVTKSFCYHTGEQAFLTSTDNAERVAVLKNGSLLHVTLDEHAFRHIYFYGTYEPEVTTLVNHLAKPGQVWLDVGANIGYFTILIASLTGPTGEVHAIEPNPDMMKQIASSIGLNKFDHVCPVESAVSEESGKEAVLYIPLSHSGQSGQSSLLVHRDIAETRKVSVGTICLDDYRARIGKAIDFMKIDVEGLEILAFRGMTETLRTQPPKVIICEVSDLPDCLVSQNELIDFLMGFGYVPYIIRQEGLFVFHSGNPLAQEDYNFAFVQPSALSLVQGLVNAN